MNRRRRKHDAMRDYKPPPYAQEAVRKYLRKRRRRQVAGWVVYGVIASARKRNARRSRHNKIR